jgi:hypothetical protein
MKPIMDRERVARLAIAAEQAGEPWTAGLLRGVVRGDAFVAFVQEGSKIPQALLDTDTRTRPAIIILAGDVPGRGNPGPADFPGVWRVFRWAAAMVFHAAAGTAEHAEDVLLAAAVVRRVLVVETGTPALPAWLEARDRYGRHAPSLVIKPRDDLPHPVETAPAGVVFQ